MKNFIERLLKKLPIGKKEHPVNFPFANRFLRKPPNMRDSIPGDLLIYTDGDTYLSCWRVDIWGRIRVLLTGNVWVWVWGDGRIQQPICVDTRILEAKECPR